MLSVSSLEDFRLLLKTLPGSDLDAQARANTHEATLTKPPGSLGRLEELSAWLCAWQGCYPPHLNHPVAIVFAGNHGVAALDISAYPISVTIEMITNFKNGGAAVNQLCQTLDVSLLVKPLDLEHPTADFTRYPAMSESECVAAITTGMATVSAGIDLLCLGEIGIANTTVAAAVCHALFGGTADVWTGPGTGVTGIQLTRKLQIVTRAVSMHQSSFHDALDVLRCVGGRELAAIAGAIIAARLQRVPVLLDGYVCTAAAAVLEVFTAGALDHCTVAHISAEPAHRYLCAQLNKTPLLDLGLRLGEASGAVLAVSLLKGAIACHNGMATFHSSGVSNRKH